jgi:hypothetical protein
MKTVFKIVGVGLGALLLAAIAWVIFDMHFGAKYETQIVTKDELSQKDISYLKGRALLKENEDIIYFYSFSGIEKGGALLTTKRIVTYDHSVVEECGFERIHNLSSDYSRSFVAMSTVTVVRNDKTEFIVEITPAANSDKKLFSKLKSLWQAQISKGQ